MNYRNEYDRWLQYTQADEETAKELTEMSEEAIENAFHRNLAFGTGGLRGIMGAGTNRVNIYTIAKASQGLADYLVKHYEAPSAVIGYDTRIKSDIFARVTAGVLAANSIKIHFWSESLPVPTVSFAVRYLGASAGVMITASHNPCTYNGYKIYGEDGCQITTKAASEILKEIEKLDIFSDIKRMDFNIGVKAGIISFISENILDVYIEKIKKQSVLGDCEANKNVSIMYTPLNGTGLKPVTRILREMGYTNVVVVKEQALPDGKFPTCPYPNPEEKEAMKLGIEYAQKYNADLLLATDPDCDRVGIAVKDGKNHYVLLSGNETGMLLLDYICSRRLAAGTMPVEPIMIKTIVTTDIGERIAENYGVETQNVLTGFKFIGEQIGILEKKGKERSYIFGFEESYGYLTGTYVRDKDGVNGAYMICEMFAYYASQGIGLLEKLYELYERYGYCLNTLHSYEFEGVAGYAKMQNIMTEFRKGIVGAGGKKVKRILDYSSGIEGLPEADVLRYIFEGDCSVVIRPSGTEPKIKFYFSVFSDDKDTACNQEKNMVKDIEKYLN